MVLVITYLTLRINPDRNEPWLILGEETVQVRVDTASLFVLKIRQAALGDDCTAV